MKHGDRPLSRAGEVALIMERDINSRALMPGQPYVTARMAAQMLGVHPRMADRARSLLVKRSLLTRIPGAGTYIGRGIGARAPAKSKNIHILVRLDTMAEG